MARKLHHFRFSESEVAFWKKQAKKEDKTLTEWLEDLADAAVGVKSLAQRVETLEKKVKSLERKKKG